MNELKGKVTFNDVAGVEKAKEEVEEIVEFLKDPKKFSRLGGKIPRCIVSWASGTGKSYLQELSQVKLEYLSLQYQDLTLLKCLWELEHPE